MKSNSKHAWYRHLMRLIEGERSGEAKEPEKDQALEEFQAYVQYLESHPYLEFGEFQRLRRRSAAPAEKPKRKRSLAEQLTIGQPILRPGYHLGRLRMWRSVYAALSVVIAAVVLLFFLRVTIDLPPFGNPGNPDLNEVAARYLENGLEETGATNIVAGLILDYRAFDTFGESTVLFAATMSVVLLLRRPRPVKERPIPRDKILQLVGLVILPAVMMFGVYVVLNGHLSPGGGFSGGTVMGCGLILCCMVLGRERLEKFLTPNRMTGMTVGCLLTYGALKGYSFITGANHIGWEVPKGTPGAIFSSGFILPLNICVGIIVACTMYTFFSLFSEREEE